MKPKALACSGCLVNLDSVNEIYFILYTGSLTYEMDDPVDIFVNSSYLTSTLAQPSEAISSATGKVLVGPELAHSLPEELESGGKSPGFALSLPL